MRQFRHKVGNRPSAVFDQGVRVEMWPSYYSAHHVHVFSWGGDSGNVAVPGYLIAAWHADDAAFPALLDYLLENDLAPPALAEAIRAAYAPA